MLLEPTSMAPHSPWYVLFLALAITAGPFFFLAGGFLFY